jgi:hypothetical protein
MFSVQTPGVKEEKFNKAHKYDRRCKYLILAGITE